MKLESDLRHELDYLSHEPEANNALNQIRLICLVGNGGKFEFDYKRIPELNGFMDKVHEGHDRLLEKKRNELLEIVRQCMETIHTAVGNSMEAKNISDIADNFYAQKKQQIAELRSLALLDGLLPPMLQYKDETVEKMEMAKRPPVVPEKPPVENPGGNQQTPAPKKVYKSLNRSIVFPAKRLESEDDIDDYVEKMRESLKQLLRNCDGIQLK